LIERVSDLAIAYLFHIINIYQRHTETISNNVKEQTNKAATKRTKTIYTVHPMYKKNKKTLFLHILSEIIPNFAPLLE